MPGGRDPESFTAMAAAAAAGGDANPIQDLCHEATCSICLEYFKDPVIISGCGHNFCRACLTRYWGELETGGSCPQCRYTAQRNSVKPNRQLANVVEIARKLNLQGGKGEGREQGVCETPQEPQKLSCKDHKPLICVACDKSKEHGNKDLICTRLEVLRKEREKILGYKADMEKESRDLLLLTEMEKQKTVEMFRQLRQFLEEQEQVLLAHMEEVEMEIAKNREEQLARLSWKLSSLERIMQEMEEKHQQQQPASNLLQGVGRTLPRSEKMETLVNPAAFPPELKQRITEFHYKNSSLEEFMKQFKDTLLMRQQFQKANITMDPDTAHPLLILSEGGKKVEWGNRQQELPDNIERFNKLTSVLGREGFTAGRHFWEVILGGEGMWALGVSRKSVRRKGFFPFSPEKGFWAVGKINHGYCVLNPPDYLPLSGEPERIRVTLDYQGKQVSFFNAETGALIYTFMGASFSDETLLPVFWVKEKAYLRIVG
nr:zinc finger protein RFP-like [Zootoca vivipara]